MGNETSLKLILGLANYERQLNFSIFPPWGHTFALGTGVDGQFSPLRSKGCDASIVDVGSIHHRAGFYPHRPTGRPHAGPRPGGFVRRLYDPAGGLFDERDAVRWRPPRLSNGGFLARSRAPPEPRC
jgi:hypothetical protein